VVDLNFALLVLTYLFIPHLPCLIVYCGCHRRFTLCICAFCYQVHFFRAVVLLLLYIITPHLFPLHTFESKICCGSVTLSFFDLPGSYPLHFHMCDSAPGSWFRDNSIHHSFQRCITVHGTDDIEVRHVCMVQGQLHSSQLSTLHHHSRSRRNRGEIRFVFKDSSIHPRSRQTYQRVGRSVEEASELLIFEALHLGLENLEQSKTGRKRSRKKEGEKERPILPLAA